MGIFNFSQFCPQVSSQIRTASLLECRLSLQFSRNEIATGIVANCRKTQKMSLTLHDVYSVKCSQKKTRDQNMNPNRRSLLFFFLFFVLCTAFAPLGCFGFLESLELVFLGLKHATQTVVTVALVVQNRTLQKGCCDSEISGII